MSGIGWLVSLALLGVVWGLVKLYRTPRAQLFSNILMALVKSKSAAPPTSSINASQKSLEITYEKSGKKYYLNVPYRKDLYTKMAKTRVFVRSDHDEIEITHQPGVPYFITAPEWGKGVYVIKDLEEGTETVLSPNQIPFRESTGV